MRSSSPRRPRDRLVRNAIAAGLALIGLVLVWAAFAVPATPEPPLAVVRQGSAAPQESSAPPQGSTAPPPASSGAARPTPRRPAADVDRSDVRDQITGLVLPEADPVEVSIPRLRVRSRLVDLGLDPDGVMEVPKDPARTGWYSRGAAPGALGPAVIAGHVTWNGTAGVFRRLGAIRPGDRVSVTRKDGKTAVFSVDRVARFPKSQFPTRDVYGSIDHAGLRLITCGGSYDAARHRYPDNVVVFARLQAVR